MKHTLTILVHSESGVGKSWFTDSGPYPRLLIDLEGRAKYTPSSPKIHWDISQPPPLADGTWSTCVATVTDYDELNRIYTWLYAGQHHFKTVGIDSIMRAQRRLKAKLFGTAQLREQDWGDLKRVLEETVNNYADLTLFPNNPIEVVCMTVGTTHDGKKYRPSLEGSIRDTIVYLVDVVGYMYMAPPTELNPTSVRSMLVAKLPGFEAKDNTDRLIRSYPDGIIPNPNLEQMHALMTANGKPETLITPTPEEVIAT